MMLVDGKQCTAINEQFKMQWSLQSKCAIAWGGVEKMSQNPFLETLKNCPCSAHYTILLKSAIAEVLFSLRIWRRKNTCLTASFCTEPGTIERKQWCALCTLCSQRLKPSMKVLNTDCLCCGLICFMLYSSFCKNWSTSLKWFFQSKHWL